MALSLKPPLPPMEARSIDEIPGDEGWQYEPKWDGFRCLAFRNGSDIFLQSKSGQPLARYFPDVIGQLGQMKSKEFVLDGELAIPVKGRLSFDELQLRLHPAASRVQKLAAANPAIYVVFDLLGDETGKSLLDLPLRERRSRLGKFAAKFLPNEKQIRLSPATTSLKQAQKWFDKVGGDLDGIIAKKLGPAHPITAAMARDLLDLYTHWEKDEPGKGHATKVAEWTAKLEAIQPPSQPPATPPPADKQ